MKLTIEDVASGNMIMRLTLDPQSLFRMITGTNTMDQLSAELLPVDGYKHVGKQCYTYTRMFKLDTLSLYRGGKRINPDDVPALAKFAEHMKTSCCAHATSWSAHNELRVSFTMRRYDNGLSAEDDSRIQACLDAAEAPEGLVSR